MTSSTTRICNSSPIPLSCGSASLSRQPASLTAFHRWCRASFRQTSSSSSRSAWPAGSFSCTCVCWSRGSHLCLTPRPVDGLPAVQHGWGCTHGLHHAPLTFPHFLQVLQFVSWRITSRKSARFRVGWCRNPCPRHYSKAFTSSAFICLQAIRVSLPIPYRSPEFWAKRP